MKIASFQKNSFIDYPGKIASVIFLGECNLRCYYCHNHQLIDSINELDFPLEELKNQVGFIDGVVITGGEPTLHPSLFYMIGEIKKLGLLVKVDTNGTNPEALEGLAKMVDYVAMDVKAPLLKYKDIVGCEVQDEVERSLRYLIKQDKVDYQFRITLAPVLCEEDIYEIARLINGAKCVQLQQFVPNEFSNSHKMVLLPYSKKDAERFAAILKKSVKDVVLRGF